MHVLCECQTCSLVYRHPRESANEMKAFYQQDYAEEGMTTELPDENELSQLMASNFAGSGKDFSYHISILQSLGIVPGMKVLDFGANWGYLSFQLKNAGYEVESFEISQPRAEFGRKLNLDIQTDITRLSGQYDCVYSSHVLEHVPNPAETLQQQFAMLKHDGLVVAHTPNGSKAWRDQSRQSFRKVWGLVHPVLLSQEFVQTLFKDMPLYISSCDLPAEVGKWDRTKQRIDACNDWGLFFAVRKSVQSNSAVSGR